MRANSPDDRPATKADIQDLENRLEAAFTNVVVRDFEPIKAELSAIKAGVAEVKDGIEALVNDSDSVEPDYDPGERFDRDQEMGEQLAGEEALRRAEAESDPELREEE